MAAYLLVASVVAVEPCELLQIEQVKLCGWPMKQVALLNMQLP